MKKLIFLLISLFWIGCNSTPKDSEPKTRIPAEFEAQESIWLGFRTYEENDPSDSVTLEIIKEIHPYVKLNLIVEHDTLAKDIKKEFSKLDIDTSNISIIIQSPTDIWYRDPGPIFAISSKNELAVIDFKYTNYSNVPPDSIGDKAKAHEGIDRDIARRLKLDTINSIVAIEGGAFETDGKGTLIQVEDITLKRNPHLSRKEIEEDLAKCCGIEKIIWLPSGVADDPHNFDRIHENIFGFATGGHTDEFVRFANDSTIIVSWIDEAEIDQHPINKLNYEILSKNFEILSNATNKEGKKYNVIKVPHPDPQTEEMVITPDWFYSEQWSKRLKKFDIKANDTIYWATASSYMNYLITNDIIIIPQYGINKSKDFKVKKIFESLYPKRKIIGLNPISFNFGGGGMHCRYQTQPKIEQY
ncbi:MAG: putative agmatine deiminase [Saprospiraceae bacterium]|nr:MAG: putative agmatine deiminase [Saprospiraceae bacterium]